MKNTNSTTRKLLILLLCLGMLCLLSACNFSGKPAVKPSGQERTEEYDLSNASRLALNLNANHLNVTLIQGESYSAVIETDEAYFAEITVEVDGDTATIDSPNRHLTQRVNITVTLPNFEYIGCAGAATIKTDAGMTLTGDVLEIVITGAAELDIDLDYAQLRCDLSGAGELNLSGNAERAEYDIKGASDIDALYLRTQYCKLKMAGAADVKVHCEQQLDVDAAGAGSVKVAGNAKIDQSTGGIVEVRRVDAVI